MGRSQVVSRNAEEVRLLMFSSGAEVSGFNLVSTLHAHAREVASQLVAGGLRAAGGLQLTAEVTARVVEAAREPTARHSHAV
jgi:hypothetical protein